MYKTMKEQFTEKLRLSKKNQEQLVIINSIIEEYAEEGYKLTLRQLYYQLVSRGLLPENSDKEYSKLSNLIKHGRMAGIVDWDAIEDRTRQPYKEYDVEDITEAIQDTIDQYKLKRHEAQHIYIELWVEKDALSGVLKRITNKYGVRLMVNKGYSSVSAMYDASKRLKYYGDNHDKEQIILYLGDHDPSGLDMIRDIKDRLNEFGVYPEVRQIGLTKQQIKKYNPPPNPAKIKDPRAKWYIKEHGNVSWEVDALTPKVLHELVIKHIEQEIDMVLHNQILLKEQEDKIILERFRDEFEE